MVSTFRVDWRWYVVRVKRWEGMPDAEIDAAFERFRLENQCCVDGCERFVRLGYMACRKHVRERERLIKCVGYVAVAEMAMRGDL